MTLDYDTINNLRELSKEMEQLRILIIADADPLVMNQFQKVMGLVLSILVELELEMNIRPTTVRSAN